MVSEGRARLFRRKDENYLIYLPKDLTEDSMFPFKGGKTDIHQSELQAERRQASGLKMGEP